jgi:hypothetical protein
VSVSAVALFGSRARGNADPHSDVDILLVTTEPRTRHVSMGNISLYLYSWSYLKRRASAGDLFVGHIAKESRALYDPKNYFKALDETFRFKTSYLKEIRQASELGWYIADYHSTVRPSVATKRIAWCVRTILIARAAEKQRPIFAASELAAFSGSPEVAGLISQKRDDVPSARTIKYFRKFLTEFGFPHPLPKGNELEFQHFLKSSKNRIAEQTLRPASGDVPYVAI